MRIRVQPTVNLHYRVIKINRALRASSQMDTGRYILQKGAVKVEKETGLFRKRLYGSRTNKVSYQYVSTSICKGPKYWKDYTWTKIRKLTKSPSPIFSIEAWGFNLRRMILFCFVDGAQLCWLCMPQLTFFGIANSPLLEFINQVQLIFRGWAKSTRSFNDKCAISIILKSFICNW